MLNQTLLYTLLLYGSAVSAALVALIMAQFWRRERHLAYLLWTLGFALAAVRYLLPSVTTARGETAILAGLAAEYASGGRGLLMLAGAWLFAGRSLPRASVLWMLLPLGWLGLAWAVGMASPWRALPLSLLGSAGYAALAWSFLMRQPDYRWHGHRFFALACGLMALHLLNYPLLHYSPWMPWGYAVAQGLHYMMAITLMLVWGRREQRLAAQALDAGERALQHVRHSHRREWELRTWTDTLLSQISDGVVICSTEGMVTGFNRAAERIFGYDAEQVLGQPVTMLAPPALHETQRHSLLRLSSRTLPGKVGSRPWEFTARHITGRLFPVEISVSDMEIDEERQFIAIVRDVSERRRQEEKLAYLADHDGLTGLPNRRCFERRLGEHLAGCQGGLLAFLDLDDFKLLNDSLGHKAGDAALRAMSRRLTVLAGENLLAARYSGDEFVLFVPQAAPDDEQDWVERLVAAVRQPIAFNGVEFMLSGSIGLAHFPEHGQDVEELVRSADLAMYEAKRAGKNKHDYYRPAMLAQLNHKAEIATLLKRLDPDRELWLAFQPRMRIDGRQLAGAEVLLRWRTPDGRTIPPDEFIPVAEETGQILRLGYWVMEQACRTLSRWPAQREPLVLSINLSARQLFDERLVERIEALRQRYHLSASQLEFEITESSAMRDMQDAVRVLSRLRALGYGLSLDDFGTGFSSLSHLRSLPVDTVKIDRSFIRDMEEDRHDRVLVASIIELAANLDLNVLAEGVETEGQLRLLDSLGCDDVQGYLVARPLNEEEFLRDILNAWAQRAIAL
jgi:diguanylate cyclase (GGDEF)-like protein/PAS domain S-box-containing protein